jgi:putative SOS response-associated peptidase YedK
MCDRYGFAPGEFREIKIRFNIRLDIPLFAPRYNIAPSPTSAGNCQARRRKLSRVIPMGFGASWAKDPSIGNRMINARAETLAGEAEFSESARESTLPNTGEWFLRVA